MIDTHCHLTSRDIFSRLGEVLAAARDAGVDRMITVGTTPEDSAAAAALVAEHEHLFATAGIHPHEAARFKDDPAGLDAVRRTLRRPRVVAIGEMGLDRHYKDPPLADQKRLFSAQLALAGEAEFAHLPIVIHNREATDETIQLIRESGLPGDRFVFHCFTGDENEVRQILDLGAAVGFTGIVTFKNAKAITIASDRVPDDRLLIETDSPYLTPEPHRKVRPNEPRYVVHVASFLADRRGMDEADFVRMVDANAERLFNLA